MKELLVAVAIASTFMMSACNTNDAEKVCAVWTNGQCMAWTDGTVDGQDGIDGQDGLSAYELAVAGGFQGTEAEWLESLKGDAGDAGESGVDGIDGLDGLSAYELAVLAGFEGTLEEWLLSLIGADGVCPDCNITVPIEPTKNEICVPALDVNDSKMHFLYYHTRKDLSDYKFQYFTGTSSVPTLAQSNSIDGDDFKLVEDGNLTLISGKVELLNADSHGLGITFDKLVK